MYDDYVMDGGYIYKSQAGVWDEAHVAKIWGASTSFWQPSAVAMYGDYAIMAFKEHGQLLQDKRVFIYQKKTFGDGSVAWGPDPNNGNSITYGVGQANAPVAVIEGYTDQGAFGALRGPRCVAPSQSALTQATCVAARPVAHWLLAVRTGVCDLRTQGRGVWRLHTGST